MSQSDTQDDAAPRDFPTLRALIAVRASSLPRRLTQVAAYALEHPDEVAFGTAASIAASADVQPSTLVRFSQALGYDGFSDLQDVFRSRLRERVLNYDERLAALREHGMSASKSGLLLDGFLDASANSVAELRNKIDHAAIDAAVDILSAAETIYLIGLRRSFPVASYLTYALGKLAVRNVLVDALAGLGAEQASFVRAGDAVLAITFAPYASETVALAAASQGRGAKVVAITDAPFSPIVKHADVWIEVAEANFEGFRSLSATMALAMTLAVAIAGRRGERA